MVLFCTSPTNFIDNPLANACINVHIIFRNAGFFIQFSLFAKNTICVQWVRPRWSLYAYEACVVLYLFISQAILQGNDYVALDVVSCIQVRTWRSFIRGWSLITGRWGATKWENRGSGTFCAAPPPLKTG